MDGNVERGRLTGLHFAAVDAKHIINYSVAGHSTAMRHTASGGITVGKEQIKVAQDYLIFAYRVSAAALSLCVCSNAYAQIEPYVEYAKLVRATEVTSPLTDSLMGDNVSLFDGQTTFENVDVDLKGNDSLPVELRRRLIVTAIPSQTVIQEFGGLGNWEIDVPSISGTFDSLYKWNTNQLGELKPRCSSNFFPAVRSTVRYKDVWQGNSVHVPGRGNHEVLFMEGTNIIQQDGQVHRWTTSLMDQFTCKPMANGYVGEGFVMTTTSGIKYTFDIGVEKGGGIIRRGANRATRTRVFLLASRIEDRFGNHVDYQYNSNGHPTSIAASDGRRIDLNYSGDKLLSASTNGRTWSYRYLGDNLSEVIMPDMSRWGYAYSGNRVIYYENWDAEIGPTCVGPSVAPGAFNITVTHPSSAVGQFNFSHMRHYRSGVAKVNCQPVRPTSSGGDLSYELYLANFHDVFSLTAKTISGPGISEPLQWGYQYGQAFYPLWGTGAPQPGLCPESQCPRSKSMRVSQPGGQIEVSTFGVLWGLNEGRLLKTRTLRADGVTEVRSDQYEYLSEEEVAGHSFPTRYGTMSGGDEPSASYIRPQVRKTVNQDGASFVWQVEQGCGAGIYCFDGLARATRVVKSSSLGFSRTEETTYFDQTQLWVMGQKASATQTSPKLAMSYFATFFPATALLHEEFTFGKLNHTLAWNADGTIRTVTNARGAAIGLSDWKRGVPQTITHPSTPDQPIPVTETANVDDNGWLTSSKDAAGYTTSYAYDLVGRMTKKTPPQRSVAGAPAWNPTLRKFEIINTVEHGIAAGHWRETITTGNAQKVTYLDAMWRPLLVHEFDQVNPTQTQRFLRFSYDQEGRAEFTSYPSASADTTQGTWNEYDELGRPTSSSKDSELGLLTTKTQYLTGFQRLTTNPREQSTKEWFQAFDEPTYEFPVRVDSPEGVTTGITRDSFGKPLEISRGGPAG